MAKDLHGFSVNLEHYNKRKNDDWLVIYVVDGKVYLQFVLEFTVISGRLFSGNLNFVSYFANFNSTDDGLTEVIKCSAVIISPYKLAVELRNRSTRLTISISDVSNSIGLSGSYS